ncbi:hypothetical protein LZC95_04540 [Pendulispora brunnea]|uniref:Uncharacterized protein n=1 Tax=Pendulispora brunnea TaxID=2905690 RepID=A0ABZ2KBN1_9BACT
MHEMVLQYYDAERASGLIGMEVGLGLAVLGLVFWSQCDSATLGRGMAYGFVVFGVLLALVSGRYAWIVERRARDESVMFAEQSEAAVAWRELARVEKVLRTSYTVPLAAFTALIAVGVVVALLSNQAPARKGVALAFMIVGVLGHTLEARSLERNQAYLGRVRASVASLGTAFD